MSGTQETVASALRYLASKVEDGFYGKGDEAFSDDTSRDAFMEDLTDEVVGKTY